MSPLMSLISIQPAPRLPLTTHIFSFLNRQDTDERRTGCVGLEADDQTSPGKDELVRADHYGQAAGNRIGSLSSLSRRRGRTFVGYVQCVAAQPCLLRRSLLRAFRQKGGHLIL